MTLLILTYVFVIGATSDNLKKREDKRKSSSTPPSKKSLILQALDKYLPASLPSTVQIAPNTTKEICVLEEEQQDFQAGKKQLWQCCLCQYVFHSFHYFYNHHRFVHGNDVDKMYKVYI